MPEVFALCKAVINRVDTNPTCGCVLHAPPWKGLQQTCYELAILCVFPHKWPSRYIKELKLQLSVAVCGLRLLTENGQLTIGAWQIKRMAIGLSCSQHRRLGWRMTLKSWLRYWQESFSTSISLFSTWRDWWYFVLFGKQVRRCYCYGGSKWSHLEWCYFVFNFTVEAG